MENIPHFAWKRNIFPILSTRYVKSFTPDIMEDAMEMLRSDKS